MTERYERLISHAELFLFTLTCQKPECGAEVTLNLKNVVHRARIDANELQSCFVCKTAFDSQLRKALVHLSAWYQLMTEADQKSDQRIIFRVSEMP